MSTVVTVHSYTHAVTYVSEKLLLSIKDIIRLSGLNPSELTSDWDCLHRGISTWLGTGYLNTVSLEVYNAKTDALIGRWDFEIAYGYSGDGSFWLDPAVIRYNIIKQGLWPSDCTYRVICDNKDGRPDVYGWSKTSYRSTDGFVFQGVGTNISGAGLASGAGYWRKA